MHNQHLRLSVFLDIHIGPFRQFRSNIDLGLAGAFDAEILILSSAGTDLHLIDRIGRLSFLQRAAGIGHFPAGILGVFTGFFRLGG